MAPAKIALVFALVFGSARMQPFVGSGESSEHVAHDPLPTPDTVDWFAGDLDLSFSCEGRVYGYYGDVKNGCQMFHVCHPAPDGHMLKSSFYCGNGTLFSQDTLVCTMPEDAFPCHESEGLYHLNDNFGRERFLTTPADDVHTE